MNPGVLRSADTHPRGPRRSSSRLGEWSEGPTEESPCGIETPLHTCSGSRGLLWDAMPRIFLDDKKTAVKSRSRGSRFYGPLVEKVLKLLEKSCSPNGGWGIGWQRERKVGPRRHSGKGNHITLAQNLHDPSIHSPSLPR